MKNNKMKWVLGILGTIVLGAIGSGLWSLLLEPMSRWVGRSLFAIATLGLNSLRNSIYVGISKGLHEEPSLALLTFLFLVPGCAFGGYQGYLSGRRSSKREKHTIISEIEHRISDPDERAKEIEEKLGERQKIASSQAQRAITFGLIALSVFCYFQLYTVSYSNSAVTHFRQCLTICEPFLDEAKVKDILSKFAQVKTRDDYVTVLNELYQVSASKNIKCPKFTAF